MSIVDHLKYVECVNNKDYPANAIVPLDDPFINQNGKIQNLLLGESNGSAVLYSEARSIRANHYHKTDFHYTFLVSGEIWYYHRPVGVIDPPSRLVITPGQLFFTPPMVEHAMAFPIYSILLTFSRITRTHENHEADLVRTPLIDASVFDTLK